MSYFGESNLGNHQERTSSSSSGSGSGSGSSRKSKKSGSDKPKQPQRGLGVAQLEKIRLHSQMGCTFLPDSLHHNPFDTTLSQEDMRLQTGYSPSPSFSYSSSYGLPGHQGIMMSMSEMERANMRYGDSQASSNPSWHHGTVYEPQQYAQPNMTRHFLSQQLEDPMDTRGKRDRSGSTAGSGDQNSDSQGNQELDLELRLSL